MGLSGASGYSGVQGATGNAGSAGSSGTSGFSGIGPTLASCRYKTNAGQSITSGADTIVNFEDQDWDTHSAVTTGASWKFTAPNTGKYMVSIGLEYDKDAGDPWDAGDDCQVKITINGTIDTQYRCSMQASPTVDYYMSVAYTTVVSMTAGQYLSGVTLQASGSVLTLRSAVPNANYICIHQLS